MSQNQPPAFAPPKLRAQGEPDAPALSSQRRFAYFAWFVLAYNVAVVIWGALVRATGSGAGCGNHWPLCNGTATPSSNLHTIVEYTHRAMTGLDTPLLILLVIGAFRAFPKGHAVRTAASLSGLFLVTEAGLGAWLVLSGHVGRAADPYTNSIHLVNTLTLLAALTLTAWWGSGHRRVKFSRRDMWLAAISLVSVMLLAVTGVIAALGDTLFPATSLAAGFAQDLDPASNILLRLRAFHPLIAAGVGTWLTVYAVGRIRIAFGLSIRVIALVWLQLFLGLTNVLLRAPVWMQLVHLLAADLLWIALVVLIAVPQPSPQKSA